MKLFQTLGILALIATMAIITNNQTTRPGQITQKVLLIGQPDLSNFSIARTRLTEFTPMIAMTDFKVRDNSPTSTRSPAPAEESLKTYMTASRSKTRGDTHKIMVARSAPTTSMIARATARAANGQHRAGPLKI